MDWLMHLIAEYGLLVVFVTVLLEQLGVPLPAYPVLLVTGALASRGETSFAALMGVAVAACLIADSVWYQAGTWFGNKVLRVLCQISLSPDSCVRQTETIFIRWGARSLLLAKFVPGFASVATALAGSLRIPRGQFLIYDTLGAALWVGVGLALGGLLSNAIEDVLATLSAFGHWGFGLVVLVVLLFVAAKWWQRHRFNRQLHMARMTVQALSELIDQGGTPLIVDVRAKLSRAEGRIPGAVALTGDELPPELDRIPRDALVVVYCNCPNDASAVLAARRLLERGFKQVRPLAGGLDAWVAAGRSLDVERL